MAGGSLRTDAFSPLTTRDSEFGIDGYDLVGQGPDPAFQILEALALPGVDWARVVPQVVVAFALDASHRVLLAPPEIKQFGLRVGSVGAISHDSCP